jgi:hypothetical protein
MGDRDVLEATWTRADAESPRWLEEKVANGSVDAFEAAWARTLFGAAEQRAKAHGDGRQDELPDQPPVEEIAPLGCGWRADAEADGGRGMRTRVRTLVGPAVFFGDGAHSDGGVIFILTAAVLNGNVDARGMDFVVS